jgi:hypothetical protein
VDDPHGRHARRARRRPGGPGGAVGRRRHHRHPLHTLLWHIGLNSFPGELAWWLQRDDRYRLVRWPNFTTLAHTPDHVRMTSLLGYASLTVDELAEQANVAPAEARRLVTAFSLMRILRSESPDVALARPALQRETTAQPTAVPARGGLFRRLLDRLAR